MRFMRILSIRLCSSITAPRSFIYALSHRDTASQFLRFHRRRTVYRIANRERRFRAARTCYNAITPSLKHEQWIHLRRPSVLFRLELSRCYRFRETFGSSESPNAELLFPDTRRRLFHRRAGNSTIVILARGSVNSSAGIVYFYKPTIGVQTEP